VENDLEPVVTDVEFNQFLSSAQSLDFEVGRSFSSWSAKKRQVNRHPCGTPTPIQEQLLRDLLSDYAEVFVPVIWSRRGFVGSVQKSERPSELDLIKQGYSIILQVGGAESNYKSVASTPTNHKDELASGNTFTLRDGLFTLFDATSNFLLSGNFAPDFSYGEQLKKPEAINNYRGKSYFNKIVKWGALQDGEQNRIRRQGWLILCRKSLVIVGLRTPNILQNERVQNTDVNTDGHDQFFVEMEIPFKKVESLSPIELVRFDGLAILLYVLHQINDDFGQYVSPNLTARGDLRNFPSFINNLRETKRFHMFTRSLSAVFDMVYAGATVARGNGVDENVVPRRELFTSALGLLLQNPINGGKYFIESSFSELDEALGLMIKKIEEDPSKDEGKLIALKSQPTLSDELERLASLKEKGFLTDDEFSDAKRALIRKL